MQRRALRAERLAAVGTLAAGLAHEVRNPQNSASLQLQLLKRRLARGETKPEAIQGIVSVVHGEILRLDRLVSEFLAFARPAVLQIAAVDLEELVHKVVDLIQPECAAAGVTVDLRVAQDARKIQADEERLRQALLNLARNAVEAMAGGGTLALRVESADGDRVLVEVEDTGPGFPENAPVFDAFYTTKESGTGLGLAIVHSLVTEHGGTVRVDSARGRTCFTLDLPRRP
jgi:signal transduction histidine kinase